MTYGHALDLLTSCALPLCTRPATITADDGRLTCARHALEETRMPTDLTALRYADTLGELVALVEQFGPFDDWAVYTGHSRRAALRWSLLELRVADRGDLALAEFIVAERVRARQQLRRDVLAVVDALGLPNRRAFLRPAR